MGGSSLLDRGAISIGTWLALSLAYLLTTGKGAPRGHGPGEER